MQNKFGMDKIQFIVLATSDTAQVGVVICIIPCQNIFHIIRKGNELPVGQRHWMRI